MATRRQRPRDPQTGTCPITSRAVAATATADCGGSNRRSIDTLDPGWNELVVCMHARRGASPFDRRPDNAPTMLTRSHSFETLQVHAGASTRRQITSATGYPLPPHSPPSQLHAQGTTRTRTRWRGPCPSTRPPPSYSVTTSTGPVYSLCRSSATCACAWVG